MEVSSDKPVSPESITTIREAHVWASRFLATKDVLFPERNAEWMLQKLLNWDSVSFLTRWNEPLPESTKELFVAWIHRRGQREPLQYILGEAEFYGRTFRVTPAVLIPRPETECLVERVIAWIQTQAKTLQPMPVLRIVDIGVGSGAIAVTLALELQILAEQEKLHLPFEVHAVDISKEALNIAKENASQLGANVIFHHGNGLQPIIDQNIAIHVVVSNPPYITDDEMKKLQLEVRDYEPHLALHGGFDGMDPYRLLVQQARTILNGAANTLSMVTFEVGHKQAFDIADMIQKTLGFQSEVFQDLAGVDRIVMGYKGI